MAPAARAASIFAALVLAEPSTRAQTTICHYYPTPANGPLASGVAGTYYEQIYDDCCDGMWYTWTLGGTPPPGLSIVAGGPYLPYEAYLEGVPTAAGFYNFTVTATSAYCGVWSWSNSIRIDNPPGCNPMQVSPTSLPGGTVGTVYSQTMAASGGTASYAFSVTWGSLPPGLSLATGGVLSGTPSYVGSYSFWITATDAGRCTATQPLSIDVTRVCTVAVSPPTLPAVPWGVAYSQTLTASGGSSPYAFAATSGALPPGVYLDTTGVLQGAATQAGLYAFVASATDSYGCVGSRSYQLPVTCGMTISPSALPDATAGSSYQQVVQAFGGAPPYSYTIYGGSLPTGMTLSALGALAGTPSGHGLASFTVMATDGNGCPGLHAYGLPVHGRLDYLAGLGHAYPNANRFVAEAPSGAIVLDLVPYGAGHWGIVVEAGDLFGDLTEDVVTGPGPGPVLGPQVRGFDDAGASLGKINFYAYGTLKYGVNASSTDIDRDAFDEILTSPGAGVVFGPHVRGWNFDAASVQAIAAINFFAYVTTGYGATVSSGDVDGDGYEELLTGLGPGPTFAPLVRGWYYRRLPVQPVGKVNFDAFPTTQYGANVRGGDVEGDAYDEIACSAGPGPTLTAQSRGFNCDDASVTALPGYVVTPFPSHYGARLALGDVAPDGRADLVSGAGWDPSANTRIKVFSYTGSALRQEPVFLTPFGAAAYGVDVAVGGLDR